MSFVLDLNTIKPISLNTFEENKNQEKVDPILNTEIIEDNALVATKKTNNEDIKNKVSNKKQKKEILNTNIDIDLLLSIKEAETLSGISKVSIRKAIKLKEINYSLDNGKYKILFKDLLTWCYSSTRRKNTFNLAGIGKYVNSWKVTIE